MTLRSRLTGLLFALLLVTQASAQSPRQWTLQDCINYALQHNIQLKQAELSAQQASITQLTSRAAVLPSVNGGATHTYNFGRTIDRYTNTFASDRVLSQNFYVSGQVTIFQGLQNYNSMKQSTYALEASRFDIERTRNDVSLGVASAYLQALYCDDQLENATRQAQLTNAQVERMKKLVDAGAQAKGLLLDLQAQLATEDVAVVMAKNQQQMAYLNLTQMMNLDSVAGFTIARPNLSAPSESIIAGSAESIYNTAEGTMPVVKSAEMNYKSADKAVDVAWGGVSPSLYLSGSLATGYSGLSKDLSSVNYNGFDTIAVTTGGDFVTVPHADYSYTTTPFSDQFENNLNRSFGFTLQVPIFNRLQNYGSISRARIQRESAQLNLDQTRIQLRKDIEQAWADAQSGLSRYNASQKANEAARESFRYTEDRFNVGAASTIDYNSAKTKLAKSELDLLQAKYDYIFKLKVLDYYQGKPITF